MIQYVHVQLSIWGRWSLRNSTKEIGYPPISPMFIGARFGGAYGSRPPVGVEVGGADQVHDMDAAVARLTQDKKRLCIEYYVRCGKGCEVAARLGISKPTLYRKIDSLHAELLGHLNDVVSGC